MTQTPRSYVTRLREAGLGERLVVYSDAFDTSFLDCQRDLNKAMSAGGCSLSKGSWKRKCWALRCCCLLVRLWRNWGGPFSLELSRGLRSILKLWTVEESRNGGTVEISFEATNHAHCCARFDLYPAGLFGYPAAAAGSHARARQNMDKAPFSLRRLRNGLHDNLAACSGKEKHSKCCQCCQL